MMHDAKIHHPSRILTVLLVCLPFGPALQNLGLLIGVGLSFRRLRQLPVEVYASLRSPAAKLAHVFLLAFLVLCMAATLLNPKHPPTNLFAYFMGYLPLLLGPALFTRLKVLTSEHLPQLERLLAITLIAWAAVVLSQALIGWRLQGVSIDLDPFFRRARGFYSHPLTLAYVAMLLFPFVQLQFLQNPRSRARQAALLGLLVLLVFSHSRTVQALVFALGSLNIALMLSGRLRLLLLAACLGFGPLVLVTDNPISKRFSVLLSEENPDRFSSYPDDRLAFWHAHAVMIQERPWLGHGVGLDHSYRQPYYEQIGLQNFRKQYEAHNQFIQAWAEGGLLALLCFVAWLIATAFWIHGALASRLHRRIGLQTLALFVLGGLTQNAFYDAEVRTALGLGILTLLLVSGRDAELPHVRQTAS